MTTVPPKPPEERLDPLGVAQWEAAHYRALAEDSGLRRLREAEAMSQVIARLRRTERELQAAHAALAAQVAKLQESRLRLAESEAMFRDVLELSQVGIGILSTEHRWLRVNEALCRMLGYTWAELETMDWVELTHPDDRDSNLALLRRAIVGETNPYDRRNRYRRKDGTYLHAHLFAVVARVAPGRPAHIVAHLVDLTEVDRAAEERLALERRLQQAQKAESLSLLAGGVAHDFNNLLCSIAGNLELALCDIGSAPVAQKYLQPAQRATWRAADLARQMLAYAGRATVLEEHIAPEALWPELEELLGAMIPKAVTVETKLAPDAPPIKADATQIRQTLCNLVLNAAEAYETGPGIVTVSIAGCEGSPAAFQDWHVNAATTAGRYLRIEVADRGCGMDPATLARIFDPFFTTKFTGRGLGLSAVLGIVRGHAGALQVQSEAGRGTVFTLVLPAATAAPPTAAPETPSLPDVRGSGTILLVDDEECVRQTGRCILEQAGFDVLEAGNGRAAVDLYRTTATSACLVLLDLTMPVLDGVQTLAELRAVNPAVRVVVASGFAEAEVTARFAGCRVAGFLQKPFKREVLLRAVQAALA